MKQNVILVVSGPSGSGKGTIIGRLPTCYRKAVSVTTRAMRPGEVEGIDYYFITHARFQELRTAGGILEFNYYDGNYYGTPRSEITNTLTAGKNVILDVDVNGAMNIKRKYPEAILVFLMPPNAAVQEERLRGRGTNSNASIAARLLQTRKELAFVPEFDCVIINEDDHIDQTVAQLMAAAESRFPDQKDIPDLIRNYFNEQTMQGEQT